MSRPRDATRPRTWLSALAVSLLAYGPTMTTLEASGSGDWPQFHHWWEAARVALIRHHELPLWDAFHCGGVSLWDQPQSMHLAPTYWLTGLALGTALGSKAFVILHATIGVAGMFTLARARSSAPAAALSALAWAVGGSFAQRIGEGHATFLAFHYLPWAVLALGLARTDLRYAAALAGLLCLILLEGGVYALPFTVLVLMVEVALDARRVQSGKALLMSVGLFVPLGAVRLWPIARTAILFPRRTGLDDAQSPRELVRAMAAADAPELWSHVGSWSEHGAFVGAAVLALAAFGALHAWSERHPRRLLLGAALFGALALGDHGPFSPWPLLHELPGFSSLHIPSRFQVVVTFYVTLLAAVGTDRATFLLRAGLRRRASWRLVDALAWTLTLAVGLDVIGAGLGAADTWTGAPIGGARASRHHLVESEDYLAHYMSYPARNVGTASCYDPVPWDIPYALWAGDLPQSRLLPSSAGQVVDEERTPARYVATVELRAPARLVINQRHDAGWSSPIAPVLAYDGLLALSLPAGRHRVEVRYSPADLPWSVLLSCGGAIGCLALVCFVTRRRRRRLKHGAPAGKAGPP